MEVTIGGDRLGSGQKNKQYLHNYERSTHNLSQKWASSMGAGMLYPFLCIPAMRGDHFSIDLEAAARTIPTKGPLFGSFKMQMDIFQCPVRLYQGILHNNPLAIGLKMSQVKLPKLVVKGNSDDTTGNIEFSNSCLLKYLGMSGLGRFATKGTAALRKINAIPALAYYDIFKNYYSNKQEENAYITGVDKVITRYANKVLYAYDYDENIIHTGIATNLGYNAYLGYDMSNFNGWRTLFTPARFETADTVQITFEGKNDRFAYDKIYVMLYGTQNQTLRFDTLQNYIDLNWLAVNEDADEYAYIITNNNCPTDVDAINFYWQDTTEEYEDRIVLKDYPLANIDEMRMNLLSFHTLGTAYEIEKADAKLPYLQLVDTDTNGFTKNKSKLNGLAIKTYQSDLFNSWVNTEWIDGENGINEITKIAVSDGGVYIDSMILARKLYDMLNRVALSGATYEDWQDAVYTESPTRHIESPLYLGGMSSEVVFEEIVQTSPAEQDGEQSTLGTLGGRGVLMKRKGGNVDVKCDEACFIIGIVSLTPRIFQTQGNEFYMTELDSLDDFHKPALDQIGFQDLLGERMAYFDTKLTNAGALISRSKIGKVPAWLEYMTAVDKAYGDFAELNGKGFMILNRNYEQASSGGIKDATTYIDPSKYNYAFAYAGITAQNFWVEIESKITARRLMSAKQIPNL